MDTLNGLFVVCAFAFQLILIIHFALRRWRFDLAIQRGWIVYALSIPAAIVSLVLLFNHEPWYTWMAGFLYLIWALFGYWVEYVKVIEWRNPIRWSIFGPYISLYLMTVMFYWWPLARIDKPLWYVYTLLFITSTILNLSSHQKRGVALDQAT